MSKEDWYRAAHELAAKRYGINVAVEHDGSFHQVPPEHRGEPKHTMTTKCWCEPFVSPKRDGWHVVTHNRPKTRE